METGVIVPPPGIFQREDIYLRKRWRRVQHLGNTFWKRWKREFLMKLQQRSKWNKENRNLQVNDIVLLKDESSPRNEWPRGRIQEVEQSNDGLACSVKLNPHQHGYKHSHIGTTRVNFDPVYIFCQIRSKCVQHPHSCYLFVFLQNFHHI